MVELVRRLLTGSVFSFARRETAFISSGGATNDFNLYFNCDEIELENNCSAVGSILNLFPLVTKLVPLLLHHNFRSIRVQMAPYKL